MRNRAPLEGLLLVASIACQASPRAEQQLAPPAPRRAGPFACAGSECRQRQPRLPDSGEWRCAERAHVVWCAGGEPASGVVPGASDASFRCGARWGDKSDAKERVCIDRRPDHPDAAPDDYECRYEQERGLARVCRQGRGAIEAALAPLALPACWLDGDCPSQRCDRGACLCQSDAECRRGRCREGVCAETAP